MVWDLKKINTAALYKTLLGILLLYAFPASAQFFGLRQYSPQHQYFTALSYPADGQYRVLNCILESTPQNGVIKRCQVLVYNSALQLSDSANLLNGVQPIPSEPLKMGNRLYWAGAYTDTINPDPAVQQLVVLELDTNYHHVALHRLNELRNQAIWTCNVVPVGNRFFVSHWNAMSDSSVIYKLSPQFVKLDSVLYKSSIRQIWGIGGRLLLNATGFPAPCADPWGQRVEKVLLDTAFNVLACYTYSKLGNINTGFGSQYLDITFDRSSLKPISTTKTVAMGHTRVASLSPLVPMGAYNVIVNTFIDNSNAVTSLSTTGDPLINASHCSSTNFLANRGNRVASVGSLKYDEYLGPFMERQNNRFFVNCFDTLGNQLWERRLGGEQYYFPTSIVFTTDGGFLVSGWRYVPVPQGQLPALESFLLKLDGNGQYEYVGLAENQAAGPIPLCFPNPCRDDLFFELPFNGEVSLQISSALGDEILNLPHLNKSFRLKTSLYVPGLYFYKITSATKTYSGKFIKE